MVVYFYYIFLLSYYFCLKTAFIAKLFPRTIRCRASHCYIVKLLNLKSPAKGGVGHGMDESKPTSLF